MTYQQCKTVVSPLLMHWRYHSLALSHHDYEFHWSPQLMKQEWSINNSFCPVQANNSQTRIWFQKKIMSTCTFFPYTTKASHTQTIRSDIYAVTSWWTIFTPSQVTHNTPIALIGSALKASYEVYPQVSNIRCTLVGNKIVDHSAVVGASPVGAAPTTSSFST